MKQNDLPIQRDYLINPRVSTEFDGDHRNDISFEGEISLTKQADAEAADINNIMKRYERTGELPDMIKANPIYGDFSDAPTFQEAHAIVAHAQSQFSALDAKLRNRFANDPAKFLEFCNDPKNLPEMEKLGLLKEKPPEDPNLTALKAIDATLQRKSAASKAKPDPK